MQVQTSGKVICSLGSICTSGKKIRNGVRYLRFQNHGNCVGRSLIKGWSKVSRLGGSKYNAVRCSAVAGTWSGGHLSTQDCAVSPGNRVVSVAMSKGYGYDSCILQEWPEVRCNYICIIKREAYASARLCCRGYERLTSTFLLPPQPWVIQFATDFN